MLMHTSEADLRTEVALLRAQMERQPNESHEIVPMASHVFVIPSSVMSTMSALMVHPEADLRAEITLLRAQMERMQSAVIGTMQPASRPDEGIGSRQTPPGYSQH